MELSDEIIINAPKDIVYAALNDPETLQRCIP
ncbi:MAG: carbon monoxide dehydrogenase, partial [Pseudomonadota bacterium]